jgi:parallel beta-helix repeat protein
MPCIHVNATDSDNDFVYTQIKTNTISNCGGPAIAFIKTRGGLIQSNTISNFNKFGIYLDNSVGSVSEKNIIVGKGYNDGQLESEGAAFAVTSYEYGATGGGSTGHLIRNNLVSNVKTSLYSICTSADCSTGTYKIGYRLYGNTFAHLRSNIFNSDSTVNTNTMANIKIVNNVFQDADSCVLNNVTTLSKLDIKYNAFVDADLTTNYHCYGQNFATGTNEEDVGFSVNLVDAYTDSIPDPVDWKATIDGMLVDGGIAADDPIITDLLMPADDYPFFVDEYLNGLYYDYGNVSRSANGFTNYGAWESINN